jgi:hypothetical protein
MHAASRLNLMPRGEGEVKQMQRKLRDKSIHLWIGAAAMSLSGLAVAGPDGPACSDGLGTATHGEHVIGDYVTGIGGVSGEMGWPPNGQVGRAIRENGGVAVPGGPGRGFHFNFGFAPGASAAFCNENAHPNGFETPGPFGED